MNYSKTQLQELWKKKEEIFNDPKNKWILDRFTKTQQIINDLLNLDLSIDRQKDEVKIGQEKLVDSKTGKSPSVSEDIYYAVAEDRYPDPNRKLVIQRLVDAFPAQEKLISDTACLLGGNDYQNRNKMKEEFRLLSCNGERTSNDDGSLSCTGQNTKISSHFFTNNYFFEIAQLLKDFNYEHNPEDVPFDPDRSRLVLHYPPHAPEDVTKEDIKEEREVLRHRFPYKFFFMWANQDKLIHLPSLMAYQQLVRQQGALEYPDKTISQDIKNFINSNEGWAAYTKEIVKLITEEDVDKLSPAQRKSRIAEVSKFISILMLNDELRLASKLLEGGCQAIILQGPPGTGKTYMAKTIAGELLGVPFTKENKKAFDALQFRQIKKNSSQKELVRPEEASELEEGIQGRVTETPEFLVQEQVNAPLPGAWELIQFHPAYTYEDFIGGISPRVDNASISYTLKKGKFKLFCDYAKDYPNGKFIFIIDEINRGDISSIFGELMYALEYRGEDINIPNFDEEFSIPQNVYLIGTMNTLDKGIATMDIAMRRRFGFLTLPPNLSALYNIFKGKFKNRFQVDEENIAIVNIADYISRCEKLNSQLMSYRDVFGIGEDHAIGQAFFAKIADFGDIEPIIDPNSSKEKIVWTITSDDRANLWLYHLKPLLVEYLGARINDDDIKAKIENLREAFVEEN